MAQAGEFRWAIQDAGGSPEKLARLLLVMHDQYGSWQKVADDWRVSRQTMRDWRRRLGIEEVAK